MNDPIRIMLVEDSAEYRGVVRLTLEEEPDIELSSEFASAEVALRSLQGRNAIAIPDLILLDIRLAGMRGLEALTWFQKEIPDTKVIMLTLSYAEADVLLAISRGASGYLLKSASAQQITDGIRTVYKGGAMLDAQVARFVLDSLQKRLPRDDFATPDLTPRELEVLTLLSQGLVKKQIAEELNIGYTTVDSHVGRIYEKLQVNNAPAAVNQAHRRGLFSSKE